MITDPNSSIGNYLKLVASLDFTGKAKTFYTELQQRAEIVQLVDPMTIPELAELIRKGSFEVEVKLCYKNATLAVLACSQVGYVEGYMHKIIPMEHAWNVWLPTGQHFDLTAHLLFDGKLADEYAAVAQPDREWLLRHVVNAELYGGVMSAMLLEKN